MVEGKFHIGSIYCLDKNNRNAKIELAKKKASENSQTIFGEDCGNVGKLLFLKDEKREQEEQVKILERQNKALAQEKEALTKKLQQKSEEFSEQKQKSELERKKLKR